VAIAIQLPPLGLGTALEGLRGAIARRRGSISACRRVAPVVADGAHAEGAFGQGSGARVGFMLRDGPEMSDLGRACLLRVQSCRQGVDFALELGDATVGLFLSLPRGRRGDALHRQLGCDGSGLHGTYHARPALAHRLHEMSGRSWSQRTCRGSMGLYKQRIPTHLESATRVACARALHVARRLGGPRGRVRAVNRR
jgi:hypothetical protein